KSGEDSNTQKLIDALQKSNLPLKSSALKILNAINKPTLRQRQLELIELIRADESGSSLAFLIEVANTSPKASKALGDILNATTYNLQKGLKELGMDNIEIRAIYENLKNKTKADYNDVMENVLGKIYDENYKTTIDSKNYLNFRKELEKSGILESDAMAFLKDVEANIYNPNGVEFKQLNNALKRLNAYAKSTNPNLNDYLKSAIRGFLKEDIKKGIDDIFAQNTQGYADSKRLFESALSDYATMKEIFKVKGIKSLMDSTKTKEEAQEAFVRYLKGQGESAKSNYEILTQNLPKEQKENLELGVIQQIFEKSISKGENELKVFDSVLFNKEIEGLKDKFTTKGAKEALELIGGFHRLFSNDGEIAYKLRPPKTGSKGLNSTIATSAEGATKQKMTSAIMDLLMRNLPELGIPFTSVKFNGINERIQGAALRYHLLSALNHSVNVEDFKKNLQKRNTPNNFNLPTRELLNSFLKQVDEVKAETLKEAENWRAREAEFEAKKDAMKLSQSIPLKEFGVNYPEYYHNGKGAIEKLLAEAKDYEARKEVGSLTEDEVKQGAYKGQVAGAFYKEGLGDIDLVWGEVTDPVNHKGYGLAHILDKHPDFDTSLIPEIIEKGNVINQNNIRYRIEKDNYVIGLSAEYKGEKKNFIITAFERYKDKSDTFTEHPFTSTSDNAVKNLENSKANSTTNTQGLQTSLSPFAKAQAEKEAQQEAKEKLQAQQEAQRDLKAKEIAQKQKIIQEQKEAESGQSSLNRNLDLGEKIQTREVKAPLNSVTLGNNEVLELKYVVVKADDLKTNFEGNALQPRTQSNPAVIERIATQFKPNLMIGRGGFEDLPILAPDGQVIAGNHRVEGMKQFNEASRKRYENAIKENFGVELESDELLLRMPKDDLENQKLVSLAFVSNANTNRTFGDRVMASLGKYSKELETIPKYFESQSVDELSTKVAKALEKNGLLPNEEEANLALLGHLAKNSNGENIAKVLTKVYQSNDRETFSKIKDMFVKNAGEFHNLVNDIGEHGLKKLELRPYLLDSINATSQSLRGTRAENFKRLAEKIDNVLKTTTKEGRNDLIESDREFYKNLIGEILGASLAKFARQENPANALYEVLKNAKADLVEALEPTLFKEGKGIENADIYDLLELLISKGEPSEPTSAVIDMLPALREKEEAYNNFIKGSQREGTSHKPQTKD
ncbi:hypothetical protein NCR96_09250, partial [Helicobacter sp. 14348-15]|uniref:putative barnase/colicin E5 family endoribonuclease n=1 Tax=Helicobacter colisuis TaxID=2949739 RepID=UPI00202B3EFB